MKTARILTIFVALVLMTTFVTAASVNRQIPSEVQPGSDFQVTYQSLNAPQGKWLAIIHDSISGGCSPNDIDELLIQTNDGEKSATVTITAPSSGSCTFGGTYQFVDESLTNLPAGTVTVSGSAPSGDSELPIALIIGIIVVIVAIVILKKK